MLSLHKPEVGLQTLMQMANSFSCADYRIHYLLCCSAVPLRYCTTASQKPLGSLEGHMRYSCTCCKSAVPEVAEAGAEGGVLLDVQAQLVEGLLPAGGGLALQAPRLVHQLPLVKPASGQARSLLLALLFKIGT